MLSEVQLGLLEWLLILFVILLLFGIPKLPQLGDSLGRAVKNFRRSSKGHDEIRVRRRDDPDREL